MEITREIRCRGCGETGKAVWDEQSWHPDIRMQPTPIRVQGWFEIIQQGKDKTIACRRCQQILPPR